MIKWISAKARAVKKAVLKTICHVIKRIKAKAQVVKKAILRGIYKAVVWIYDKPWAWYYGLVDDIENSFWDALETLREASE